jgi:hypothetical protein
VKRRQQRVDIVEKAIAAAAIFRPRKMLIISVLRGLLISGPRLFHRHFLCFRQSRAGAKSTFTDAFLAACPFGESGR